MFVTYGRVLDFAHQRERVGSVFAGTLAEHYWHLDPRFAGLVRLRRC